MLLLNDVKRILTDMFRTELARKKAAGYFKNRVR